MSTISKLTTSVVDSLFLEYPNLFGVANKSVYTNALQLAVSKVVDTDIALDTTSPDYERVMLEIIQELSQSKEWADILVAGSGHAVLRMIASGIAYDQFAIERTYQEAFIHSASSDTAIYAATRMLGVRPRRKLPSSIKVDFTREDVATFYEIPKYSRFVIKGVDYFNRERIGFKSSQTVVGATLYQGKVVDETITSDGEPFQEFTFGNGSRTASDTDIILTILTEEWERVIQGPWSLEKDATKYYETTTSNGDLQISFGNGDFGRLPPINTPINLKWVQTLGKSGNGLTAALTVVWSDMPSTIFITGTTTSASTGGDDEIDISVYRKTAPNLRAANSRAVRRSDYKDLALQFSGVKDALFRGQAELAPGRRSMMNVIGVTLLTDTTMSGAEFLKFDSEFRENLGIYQTEFLRIDPTPVTTDIEATIYCSTDADLEDIKAQLTKGIENLFSFRRDFLGYSIYKTDITDVLNGRNPDEPSELLERQVEYVVLAQPTADVVLTDKTQYVKLNSLTLTMSYTTRGSYAGNQDYAPQNQ